MLSKLERVERTLNHLPVDQVAIHDVIANNDRVIAHYAGGIATGSPHSQAATCAVVRRTIDLWRPYCNIVPEVVEDGFGKVDEGWTSWVTEHPFHDTKSLKEYLLRDIERTARRIACFDAQRERQRYRQALGYWRDQLQDDTVLMGIVHAPLREYLWRVGIVLFSYLYYDEPEVIERALQTFLDYQLKIIAAAADHTLSPVVLIATEACSRKGPLFSLDFYAKTLFREIALLSGAYREKNIKVLVEIQGDTRSLIEPFLSAGADGFYAVEPVSGMDIVAMKNKYPQAIWACGLDGIEIMGGEDPERVRREVRRQIEETDCLNRGGFFLGTSSEINANIPLENYRAMIGEANSLRNEDFQKP
jgi:hypothetical protein